jgi:hypothetical protein
MSYIINRERLAAFLVDPTFYRHLPELEELRPLATLRYSVFMTQRKGCCRDISVMFPSLQAAMNRIEKHKDDPGFVARLRSFLHARLGTTVDHVLFFYRETGKGPLRRILLR